MAKAVSTRFSIVKRSKGQSAVEKSSYISRCTLISEYTGETYKPKYHEDLVYSEISLPEHAPKEFADRSILWNSVEQVEKNKNAQLARMVKLNMPNAWSYDLAVATVRDYVQEHFVSKGMCAEWAVHDSYNEQTGQRNLHAHIMLTLRPLEQDGAGGEKQKKVYVLDKNGERIPVMDKKTGQQKVDKQNRKQWKCNTVATTDWNSLDNAKKWRAEWAERINATNEQIGLDEKWEHRSFKEQGIDRLPTIHLGAIASALERKGIRTERGDMNRFITEHNRLLESAKAALEIAEQTVEKLKAVKTKTVNFVRKVSNEVLDMIDRMAERKPTLLLPLVKGKYISSISNRDALLNFDNARSYVKEYRIDSFSTLATLKGAKIKEHDELEQRTQTRSQKIARLKALSKAYSECEAYKAVAEQSASLSGLKKLKFDKEHEQDLSMYQAKRKKLTALLNGEKVTPKAWHSECDTLIKEQQTDERSMSRKAVEIAFAQVLENNHKQLTLMEENESHKQGRSIQRKKEQEV